MGLAQYLPGEMGDSSNQAHALLGVEVGIHQQIKESFPTCQDVGVTGHVKGACIKAWQRNTASTAQNVTEIRNYE
jgi:hypothetical protein